MTPPPAETEPAAEARGAEHAHPPAPPPRPRASVGAHAGEARPRQQRHARAQQLERRRAQPRGRRPPQHAAAQLPAGPGRRPRRRAGARGAVVAVTAQPVLVARRPRAVAEHPAPRQHFRHAPRAAPGGQLPAHPAVAPPARKRRRRGGLPPAVDEQEAGPPRSDVRHTRTRARLFEQTPACAPHYTTNRPTPPHPTPALPSPAPLSSPSGSRVRRMAAFSCPWYQHTSRKKPLHNGMLLWPVSSGESGLVD